ncbi:MAG: hypothetical protein GY807_13055 [Gammaproteobacteria bacterium]|nr:hypothetical protein [Gammaproteobacteria bacterium]
MIVEYAGLPGCGKSTLERRVTARLQERGIDVVGRREVENRYISKKYGRPYARLGSVARAGLYLQIWLRYAIRSVLAGHPTRSLQRWKGGPGYWAEKDVLLYSCYLANHRKYCREARMPELYCPSEGLVQHLAGSRVWFKTNNRNDLQVLEKLPLELLCIVRPVVPVEEAFKRFIVRGIPHSWPASIKTEQDLRSIHARYVEVLEVLLDGFKAHGARVIGVDLSGAINQLEEQVNGVTDSIEQALAGADP